MTNLKKKNPELINIVLHNNKKERNKLTLFTRQEE